MVVEVKMMKLYGFLLLLLLPLTAFAQASLSVQAPSTVQMEQNFKLQFVCKGGQGVDFRAPSLSDFEVLFDKAISQNKTQGSTTYTYTLRPKKLGKFTIGEASIRVDDRTLKSKPYSITVLAADKSAENAAHSNSQAASNQISESSLFIKAVLSKTKVYEQEAILVSYKLYTLHPSVQFEQVKFPEYTDFIAQDIEDDGNKQLLLERYQGKNYQSVVLKQTLLFPQKSGKLSIPSGRFDVLVYLADKAATADDVFAGKAHFSKIRRSIHTPAIPVDVVPLPEPKPAGFEGSVGKYSLKASILESGELKSNETLTLRVEINGSGNFKLLGNPAIKFPDSFELYDPKVESQLHVSSTGVTGTRQIDYILVPRMSGDFEIPSISISYFDPQAREYKVSSSTPIKLKLAKGENESAAITSNASETNKREGLRPLKSINKGKLSPFLSTGLYLWVVLIVIALAGAIAYYLLRQHIKQQADVQGTRSKKAKSKAIDRLSKAKEYSQSKQELFNEELLLALRQFLSDKMALASSALSKSSIEAALEGKGISNADMQKLTELLEDLEFNRFAAQKIDPQKQAMQLEEAEYLIKLLDSKIKR